MANDKRLTTNDRILWGKVARTTRPMPGNEEFITELEAELQAVRDREADLSEERKKTPEILQPETAETRVERTERHRHHPFEWPVKRKLAKGRLPIEARIDLHGLFQSDAHAMLLGFLTRAHERGLRHVLVITGKGSSMGSEGALKRAVPLWFSKPEFRHLISSFEESAQVHGGGGALYVRLSRSRFDRS